MQPSWPTPVMQNLHAPAQVMLNRHISTVGAGLLANAVNQTLLR
ncbi:hypothetical protein [Pseudomonas lutea]|nr:hypothetical protein [Pseudomonas lutea]